MPIIKLPLAKRLDNLRERETSLNEHLRALAMTLVRGGIYMKPKTEKDMEKLYARSKRLLSDLEDFWELHPDLLEVSTLDVEK